MLTLEVETWMYTPITMVALELVLTIKLLTARYQAALSYIQQTIMAAKFTVKENNNGHSNTK
jgi:hypothetical protein